MNRNAPPDSLNPGPLGLMGTRQQEQVTAGTSDSSYMREVNMVVCGGYGIATKGWAELGCHIWGDRRRKVGRAFVEGSTA